MDEVAALKGKVDAFKLETEERFKFLFAQDHSKTEQIDFLTTLTKDFATASMYTFVASTAVQLLLFYRQVQPQESRRSTRFVRWVATAPAADTAELALFAGFSAGEFNMSKEDLAVILDVLIDRCNVAVHFNSVDEMQRNVQVALSIVDKCPHVEQGYIAKLYVKVLRNSDFLLRPARSKA